MQKGHKLVIFALTRANCFNESDELSMEYEIYLDRALLFKRRNSQNDNTSKNKI